jgi:predicted anti-sigma-YlaC factor YlaD
MECHDASTLISAYLDGELTQADAQRLRLHLEDCRDCARTHQELRLLKEQMGQLSYPNADAEMLKLLEHDAVSLLGKWSGWLLLLIPGLVLAAYGLYEFYSETGELILIKVLFGAFQLGMLILFITVLRQRLLTYKKDKYRNVKL